MNTDFATAMRRALESTRASRPEEATAIIRQALAGSAAGAGGGASAARPRHAPTARFSLIDPAADDAEPGDRPGGGAADTARPTADAEPDRPRGLPFSVVDGCRGRRTGRVTGGPARNGEVARRSLRTVLDSLAQGSGGAGARLPRMRAPSAPPPVPAGARYEMRSYSAAAGSRAFRLYVPASLSEDRRGLIVMLHGCTQTPDDFASGTRMNAVAEEHGLIVAYPEQTSTQNPSACWNWFRPGDQRKGAGEPAIIAGLTGEIVREFGVDRARVFVAGLSAGGAMAAVMAEAYPELYAAVGVHSGLPCGSASDVASAFAAMRGDPAWSTGAAGRPSQRPGVRTIVFHGAADTTVHPSNGEKILARLRDQADREEMLDCRARSPGGRSYTRSVLRGRDGAVSAEFWLIDGAGHAWSGGDPAGSYTDPAGPDASMEMVRFFLAPTEGTPA